MCAHPRGAHTRTRCRSPRSNTGTGSQVGPRLPPRNHPCSADLHHHHKFTTHKYQIQYIFLTVCNERNNKPDGPKWELWWWCCNVYWRFAAARREVQNSESIENRFDQIILWYWIWNRNQFVPNRKLARFIYIWAALRLFQGGWLVSGSCRNRERGWDIWGGSSANNI